MTRKFGKKRERDEDSDGGDAAAPTKKTKTPKKEGLSSGTDADGNPYWELSAKRRVGISTFKSMVFVNVREYYEQDGQSKPGKKGISLSVEQYQALLKAAPAISAELRKMGQEVEEEEGAAVGGAADEKLTALVKKEKKQKPKANIEATSDEDSS